MTLLNKSAHSSNQIYTYICTDEIKSMQKAFVKKYYLLREVLSHNALILA